MPLPDWQLFDRVRAYLRRANVFRQEGLFQDQTQPDRILSGGDVIEFSKTAGLLEQTNLQINRLERYKDYDMMDEVGEITLALDIYCLHGNTRILLLDGTCPTIKELTESGKKEFWLYSFDSILGSYVPAKGYNPHVSGMNAKMVEVTFDNGLKIKCTPNHKFQTFNGMIEARKLVNGQSVIPSYKTIPPVSFKHDSLFSYFLSTKVVSVVPCEDASEVYDIAVEKHHCFAAGDDKSWVIVHNSDEASLTDPERKHSVIVKSKSKKIVQVVEDLLYNVLLIDNHVRPMIRYLCKYGDFASEIVPTKNRDGISSLRFINIYNFTRVQTKYGDLVGFYYQDPNTLTPYFLHPWQVMHMRLTSFEQIYNPYGRCCIFGTKVSTPTGFAEIQDLRAGDMTYCFDGYQKKLTTIIDMVNNGDKQTYSIHTVGRTLNLTHDHPVMVYDRHQKLLSYKPVCELQSGDNCDYVVAPQLDGTVEIEGISRIEKRDRKPVFDIGVKSNEHNFIAEGAVIHNSILDGSRKDFKRLRMMEDAALIYRICVRGDTRVRTTDGYKYIKDIKTGETAYCLDRDGIMKETKIINHVCNGMNKIYRVSSQHREIYANTTHPVLVISPYKKNGVMRYDKLEYVDVKDLKTLTNTSKQYCHRFVMPKQINQKYVSLQRPEVPQYARFIQEIPISENINSKVRLKTANAFAMGQKHLERDLAERVLEYCPEDAKSKIELYQCWSYNTVTGLGVEYDIPKVATEEFARWFGFMIGDGFVSRRRNEKHDVIINQVGFACGDDVQMNEKYKQLFEKFVRYASFGNNDSERLGAYYVYSKPFVDFMLMNGFIPGCHNKRIPAWVYESPRSVQEAFVDGYVDADGNSRMFKGGITEAHTLESCNHELIEDFKELIDRMGWSAGLVNHRNKPGGHIINKRTGRIMPATESWSLYFTKNELSDNERIFEVKEAGEDLVYDVTVENDVHNITYNGVQTHQTRAPEKRIFSIPIGNIPSNQIHMYITEIARQFKKHKFVDPATGQVNERYSPLIQEDDFFLPKRPDGSGPEITTLPGAQNLDQIEDILYFKKKMIAGTKIPFSRVGIGEQSDSDSKSLSSVSPEFAKAVQWIQRECTTGLKKVVIVHLALQGYSIEEIKDFDLSMTASSAIDELYRIETWNTRADIIRSLKESGLFPPDWILRRFTDMTDDEIYQLEKDQEAAAEKAAESGQPKGPDELGMGGGGGGLGDLGLGLESTKEDDEKLLQEYAAFEKRLNVHRQIVLEDSPTTPVEWFVNANEMDNFPKTDEDNDATPVLVKSIIEDADVVKKEFRDILTESENNNGDDGENSDVKESDLPK